MAKVQKVGVGVVGLGIVGSRAAANLRKAGFHVSVWSRSPRPEPNFLASPHEIAESAQFVEIFVSDGPALIEVMEAMAPALGPSHIVLNHATVSPAETREAARLAEDRHARYLDAPFTGSRDAAAAGALIFYVGGAAETLQAARPVLEANAKQVLHVGSVGEAAAIKVATNLIAAASVAAYAEALALLHRSGIPLQKLPEALEGHAVGSTLSGFKIPGMITGTFEPHFALKHMFKDMQIALRMAQEAGIELPTAAAFAGAAMSGIQQGWAGDDFSSIARHYGYPDPEAPLDPRFRPAAPAASAPAEEKATPRRWKVFGAR
jgi:3-hydroxyisobutyrate dehydrogenase-like beta-hydroxyacid dehydrogenase